jgi:thioredoxin reductase (NADPH)
VSSVCLQLSNGERVSTRAVVIASGARYRWPAVDSLHAFEGSSAHYWATPLEGKLCANQEIALVGEAIQPVGQRSTSRAGAQKVWMLLRGSDPGASMSRYLY